MPILVFTVFDLHLTYGVTHAKLIKNRFPGTFFFPKRAYLPKIFCNIIINL